MKGETDAADRLLSPSQGLGDSAGARQAELRYFPYGKTRYTYGATPTTYRFTGQRQQTNANELYFYQARWYDPLVGRFLSADTIVPDPTNPQALNRYSYTLNNPLRYTDPTGHFSEEEIMQHYGVKTWAEVLALFQQGGQLQGLWGWLETLRQGKLGQSITWYEFNGGLRAQFVGTFAEANGRLVAEGSLVGQEKSAGAWPADAIAKLGAKGWYGTNGFITESTQSYKHLRYDSDKVDWTSVGLGVGGLGQDIGVVVGIAGVAHANPAMTVAGVSMVGLGTAAEAAGAARTFDQYKHGKATLVDLAASWGSSAFGLVPGPVGITASVAGIGYDLGAGIDWSP